MTISEVLLSEFTELSNEIKKAYNDKGMRASGEFERSLKVNKDSDLKVSLTGKKYVDQLEYGRRPGNVSKEGKDSIREWIENKGVFSSAIAELGIDTLTFLIARKIQRDGYNRAGYGGVDLISEIVTPERIQKIIDKVGMVAVVQYTTEMKDRFNIFN